jgi:hypothetical protein
MVNNNDHSPQLAQIPRNLDKARVPITVGLALPAQYFVDLGDDGPGAFWGQLR